MGIFFNKRKDQEILEQQKTRFYRKRWFTVTVVVLFLLFGGAGFFLFKTGNILNKISDSDTSTIGSLFGVLPGVGKEIKEDDGRINILLLGMRGENIPGGGLLADTIMIVSLLPDEDKMSLISIPRDLYVKVPGTQSKAKINAVYAYGEENGKRQGLSQMKKIVGEVTGLNMHYSASINFTGFKQLVNIVGGVEVTLETPFYETTQFVKGNECGGQFFLPKGPNTLDGEKALCYVRSRENTSDFDRAKRQQIVLQSLKNKLISLGTLTDFSKVNNILNSVGQNVRTDMSASDMKKFFDKYSSIKNPQLYQRVFENSLEGLLMVPADASSEIGYVLIPRAGWDNYTDLNYVCRNIFTVDPQTDIMPMKQYAKPAVASSSDGGNSKETEEYDSKKLKVRVDGKLSMSDGLEAAISKKIKEIKIEGEYKKDYIKVDLDDLKKVKKEDDVKVRIEDLDLPKDVKVVSHDDRDVVVLISVTEEAE